jgi:hypothetical protein
LAGLVEKRRQLDSQLDRAGAEIKMLVIGLDALDIALNLFDADEIKGKPMRRPRKTSQPVPLFAIHRPRCSEWRR